MMYASANGCRGRSATLAQRRLDATVSPAARHKTEARYHKQVAQRKRFILLMIMHLMMVGWLGFNGAFNTIKVCLLPLCFIVVDIIVDRGIFSLCNVSYLFNCSLTSDAAVGDPVCVYAAKEQTGKMVIDPTVPLCLPLRMLLVV